jgi:hypothetical protein
MSDFIDSDDTPLVTHIYDFLPGSINPTSSGFLVHSPVGAVNSGDEDNIEGLKTPCDITPYAIGYSPDSDTNNDVDITLTIKCANNTNDNSTLSLSDQVTTEDKGSVTLTGNAGHVQMLYLTNAGKVPVGTSWGLHLTINSGTLYNEVLFKVYCVQDTCCIS